MGWLRRGCVCGAVGGEMIRAARTMAGSSAYTRGCLQSRLVSQRASRSDLCLPTGEVGHRSRIVRAGPSASSLCLLQLATMPRPAVVGAQSRREGQPRRVS